MNNGGFLSFITIHKPIEVSHGLSGLSPSIPHYGPLCKSTLACGKRGAAAGPGLAQPIHRSIEGRIGTGLALSHLQSRLKGTIGTNRAGAGCIRGNAVAGRADTVSC